MAAPVAAVAATGGRAAASAGGRAAVGRAGAGRHAAARRPVRRPGGPRHAAGGQLGRDVRQVADLGMAYVAGRGGRRSRSRSRPSGRGPTRAIVAEFLLCSAILALSPLSRPQAEGEVAPRDWMKRATALCVLFALLGMLSAIGPRSARTAAAIGGLVTLVLVVDQRSAIGALASRLRTTGSGQPPQVGPPDEDDDDLSGVIRPVR